MPQMPEDTVLQVTNLKKYFPIESGFLRRKVVGNVRAVDGVSFYIKKGRTLGLVGESGCGKTTVARTILRAIDPTEGSILFRTRDGIVDMATLDNEGLKKARTEIQMVFQDPYSSLNPRMPIMDIIAEPLRAHGYSRKDQEERVKELLELVGLRAEYARRYPHSFSGGQRQRIGIARALALNPSVVVADEPVSALDVSVQAQVLNLLLDLQEQMGLTYLFISHDLSVVRYLCDRVAVMYLGRIVELADVDILYGQPRHPYTSTLLSSVPDADPRSAWHAKAIKGEITGPPREVRGCAFAPRCPYAVGICKSTAPELRSISTDESVTHEVACHLAEELELEGVS